MPPLGGASHLERALLIGQLAPKNIGLVITHPSSTIARYSAFYATAATVAKPLTYAYCRATGWLGARRLSIRGPWTEYYLLSFRASNRSLVLGCSAAPNCEAD